MHIALFRADGGPAIGDGHLSRNVALAHVLKNQGWNCHLLTSDPLASGLEFWKNAGIEYSVLSGNPGGLEDAQETLETLKSMRSTPTLDNGDKQWLCLDGYHFGNEMWEFISEVNNCPGANHVSLLAFDDLAEMESCVVALGCDVVVNQNSGAEVKFLNAYPKVGIHCLGASYACLRPGVLSEITTAESKRFSSDYRRILISLGASQGWKLPLQLAKSLLQSRADLAITVVAEQCLQHQKKVELGEGVTWKAPTDIAPIIAASDLVVIGGGVSALEAAFLGVPSVILVLADNQGPGAYALEKEGVTLVATSAFDCSEVARKVLSDEVLYNRMKHLGQQMIDGKGPARIANLMNSL